jgi:hypothetical protein
MSIKSKTFPSKTCEHKSQPHLWALLTERLEATCHRSRVVPAWKHYNTMSAVVLPQKGIYMEQVGPQLYQSTDVKLIIFPSSMKFYFIFYI